MNPKRKAPYGTHGGHQMDTCPAAGFGLPPHPGRGGTHPLDALVSALVLALDREMRRLEDEGQKTRLEALHERTRGQRGSCQAGDHEQ